MESFNLFVTNVSTVFKKILQMAMKKMHFYTHIEIQPLVVLYQLIKLLSIAVCFSISKDTLLFHIQESLIWKMSKLLINIIY